MTIGKLYIIYYCGVLFLYVFGISLFTKGFLLKRAVVVQNSSCVQNQNSSVDQSSMTLSLSGGITDTENTGCWLPRLFTRAVIVIIDALRFDFVAYDASNNSESNKPYKNKLKNIHQLLKNTHNSRLYHFWADPPTTTMQRLKGLTTGSLPTFVDAGANFDSSEISEDNFIDQLLNLNKNIAFMGDDTWNSLFPNRFFKSYHFPSFNVKDLHTVDNGILEHLMPTMKANDWDILIAHFLGVDHCGHRYGPDHSAMTEKLVQMDEMLGTLVQELQNDTILLVFGDHGMTRTGDHGGDSVNELDAALFVYSPVALTHSTQELFPDIAQVDLVPTISLLLGAPIPFSNLGAVITDLFDQPPKTLMPSATKTVRRLLYKVHALAANAAQLHRYLLTYAETSDEFPYMKFADLKQRYSRVMAEWQVIAAKLRDGKYDKHMERLLEKLIADFRHYLFNARDMCKEVWAKFDIHAMILGIVAFAIGLGLSMYFLTHSGKALFSTTAFATFAASVMAALYVVFLYYLQLSMISLLGFLLLGFTVIAILATLIRNTLTASHQRQPVRKTREIDPMQIFSISCMFLYVVSLSSNSFVVFEDTVICFLLQSWAFFQIGIAMKFRPVKRFTQLLSPLGITITLTLCIRLAMNFRQCREEQWTCEYTSLVQPMSTFSSEDTSATYRQSRFALSAGSILMLVTAVRWWLRRCGNANGYAPSVLCASYGLPAMCIIVCLHWALQTLPHDRLLSIPDWQLSVLPQVIYVIFAIILLCLIAQPLLVHKKSTGSQILRDCSVPSVFNYIKTNWNNRLAEKSTQNGRNQPTVFVYGLATVYSSCHLVLVSAVAVLVCLVLRDGVTASVVLQLAAMFCVLELHAYLQNIHHKNADHRVPWSIVYVWGMLSSHHFFATGHQMTFPTIQWEASYTGFDGDFNVFVIPILLLLINTFASHIVGVVALPLLLFWPKTRHRSSKTEDKLNENLVDCQGEHKLVDDSDGLRLATFKLILGSLTFYASKLLLSMFVAALHRRHLMVWKIFAPRFIFEVATFVVVSPLLLLIYFMVIRVDTVLTKWLLELNTSTGL